jgi:hypothetical protein
VDLALQYRDGLHTFIAPHNGHPTLVPFTIYRLLFATVGIDHSAPYRAVGIAAHLLIVALLYVYAARRAGAAIGFLAAAAILFLGPAGRTSSGRCRSAGRSASRAARRPARARPPGPARATSPRACCS